jgi:hypothetical protein
MDIDLTDRVEGLSCCAFLYHSLNWCAFVISMPYYRLTYSQKGFPANNLALRALRQATLTSCLGHSA